MANDYAAGIARITIMIGDEPPLKPLIDIPRMAEQTEGMLLRRSLEAFEDAEAAKKISMEDDLVDQLYDQVFRSYFSLWQKTPRRLHGQPAYMDSS